MTRLDRILLAVAYVGLVALVVVGVWRVQVTLDHAEDRRCDIEQVQLASLNIILKSVQLDPDADKAVVLQQIRNLQDDVQAECP